MNKLLYILLFMLVAGTVSCHRTSEVEARLIAIDSLIPAAPDSALALLEAIDTASLHGEMRAYHALLTAQALYKAYIPATSDSLINRAWDYYKDHGSYDRRIRAMLYKGTTAEETGHPDTAMYWYKRTELESRPDDHYHRGYALMNMGILYQGVLATKHALSKYRYALEDFEAISDTSNILYCSYQLSRIYQLVTPDSSDYYLDMLGQLAQARPDTSYLVAAMTCRAAKKYYANDFEGAKNEAIEVITRFHDIAPFECWHYASYSYSKLGIEDSAYCYFNESPVPLCTKDSILYYESKKALNELHKNWDGVYENDSIATDVADKKIEVVFSNSLSTVENTAEKQFIKIKNTEKVKHIQYLIMLLLLIITVVVGYVIVRRLKWHRELTEMRKFIGELENQKSSLSINNRTLNNEIDNLQNSIEPLTDVFRTILTAVRRKPGIQLDKTIKNLLSESFFSHIYQYVDYTHPGLMAEMRSSQSLSKRDIDIVCLYLCHLPDSVIQIYADLKNIRSVNKLKKTIAVKLRDSKDASIEHLRKF